MVMRRTMPSDPCTEALQALEEARQAQTAAFQSFKERTADYAAAIEGRQATHDACIRAGNPSANLQRERRQAVEHLRYAKRRFNAAFRALGQADDQLAEAYAAIPAAKITSQANAARTTPVVRPQAPANGSAPAGRIRRMLGL